MLLVIFFACATACSVVKFKHTLYCGTLVTYLDDVDFQPIKRAFLRSSISKIWKLYLKSVFRNRFNMQETILSPAWLRG